MTNRSGVYAITNTVNGNQYVGSAIDIRKRIYGHKWHLSKVEHHSRHLQSAWQKYGRSAFQFRILLVCAPPDLLLFEQRAINALRPEYNICKKAGSTLGIVQTEDTRRKISARLKGRKRSPEAVEASASKLRGRKARPEHVAHLKGNKHAVGLVHTEEWKRENSERNKGKKRPKSPEYRAKISAALKGIKHSPERRAAQAAGQLGTKRGPYKLDPAKAEQRRLAGKHLAAVGNWRRWGYGPPPAVKAEATS
jgi:group I intron endonuclease